MPVNEPLHSVLPPQEPELDPYIPVKTPATFPAEPKLPLIDSKLVIITSEYEPLNQTYCLLQKTCELIEKGYMADARNVILFLLNQGYICFQDLNEDFEASTDVDMR